MQKYTLLLLIIGLLFLAIFQSCESQEKINISIIPKPVLLIEKTGEFEFGNEINIECKSKELQLVSEYLKTEIVANTNIQLNTTGKPINLILDNESEYENNEAYKLNIFSDKIDILAPTSEGIFYGIQTLFQLLPSEFFNESKNNIKWTVPCVEISDYPRFKYRGMHLDICRHFFPVSFVKRYIDYLAMHKLNTLHFHLTEDQGWRIEIKKYPKLTEIGSIRKGTVIGRTNKYDGEEYGGFYTQDEIREIVKYASERHITVIPEIELPGHSVAALTAYPEYSCTGGPFEVRKRWGVSKDIYCAGNEKTFEFLENILIEVLDLFPSKYIHIGGDEAPKDRWEKCPKCQKRIKDEGLHNEHELQSYFIKRMEKFLNDNGRKLIGWDEILEGGLAPDATVMSWRGIQGGVEAAKQNHDVIMVPYSHLYFDGYQADPEIEPLAIGYWAPLERVYSFNPIPEELTEVEAKHVIGCEATLWTEFIATEEYAEYMFLPRLSALSEICWTQQSERIWNEFQGRLQKQYKRYFELDANFRIPTPEIKKLLVINKGENVVIENPIDMGTVHYTLDGSVPNIKSPKYQENLVINENSVLKSSIFLPDGRSSSVITTTIMVKEDAPNGLEYGLNYDYYEEDFTDSFPNFVELTPKTSGTCINFDVKNIGERNDKFGVIFTGKIDIESTGKWTFYLTCDDGAKLYIDGKEIIGSETYITQPVSDSHELSKGLHDIKLEFYEWGGAENVKIELEGPDYLRQPVKPWMLFR